LSPLLLHENQEHLKAKNNYYFVFAVFPTEHDYRATPVQNQLVPQYGVCFIFLRTAADSIQEPPN
jgi:hypothetical protein